MIDKWEDTDVYGNFFLQKQRYATISTTVIRGKREISIHGDARKFLQCSDIDQSFDYLTSRFKQPMLWVVLRAQNNN